MGSIPRNQFQGINLPTFWHLKQLSWNNIAKELVKMQRLHNTILFLPWKHITNKGYFLPDSQLKVK